MNACNVVKDEEWFGNEKRRKQAQERKGVAPSDGNVKKQEDAT